MSFYVSLENSSKNWVKLEVHISNMRGDWFCSECEFSFIYYFCRPLTRNSIIKVSIFRCVYILVIGAIVTFLILDTRNDRKRLIGLCGMGFYVCLMFLMSVHPSRINWRPVILGFLLQFIMGLLVLRWKWGGERFNDASDLVIKFLKYTDNGTSFVYGFLAAPPNICGMDPVFAFSVSQFNH